MVGSVLNSFLTFHHTYTVSGTELIYVLCNDSCNAVIVLSYDMSYELSSSKMNFHDMIGLLLS